MPVLNGNKLSYKLSVCCDINCCAFMTSHLFVFHFTFGTKIIYLDVNISLKTAPRRNWNN